jgi:hypothetical protein
MTIDHTGHAASGCPQFDLTKPPRKASETPDDLTLVNITAVPAKAFRTARVIDDECMECNGPLGEEWHVSRKSANGERDRHGQLPGVAGMTLLAIALLSILPRDDTVRESVERTDVNQTYNYDGEPNLRQIIFWEANDHCRDWRMAPEGKLHFVGNAVYFMDNGLVRCITARTVTESHTMYDPETYDRELWPKEIRRELKQAKGR